MNVWLATLVAEHPHHDSATAWWRRVVPESDTRVAFCRITQLGLLRLLGNVRVMGEERKTLAAAWAIYERLLSQPPVVFAPEPEGTEQQLAKLSRTAGSSGKSGRFWTDGYLAAFAQAGELRLATFDRGFRRFEDLDLELLQPGEQR